MRDRRHAEIAGGGFTGLTLAAALAQRGWSVRVHERAAEIRAFGAGIWLWENGVRVLNAIGAADEALTGCTEAPDWRSWDRHGRLIDSIAFGRPYSRVFCLPREQLLQAILNTARRAGAEIVTGSKAVAARPGGELLTADGTAHPANLGCAADGVNSMVRDSLDQVARRDFPQAFTRSLDLAHVPGQESRIGLADLGNRLTSDEVKDLFLFEALVGSAPAQDRNIQQCSGSLN